jgi:hypothetical protein
MPIDSSSRFKNTPFINVDGVPQLSRWVEPDFLTTAPYQLVTVLAQFEGRPDNLSQYLYGTPEYFWVLVAFNKPSDTLNWPKAGEIIKVPDVTSIIAEQ